MGTGLAEAIGAAKSSLYEKLFCIIGDGSFLMNVQDLQVINQDQLNIKIVVVNNNGYLAIRQTTTRFFSSRFYGTHPDWKLKMPSIKKIADAFEIPYVRLDQSEDTDKTIECVLETQAP